MGERGKKKGQPSPPFPGCPQRKERRAPRQKRSKRKKRRQRTFCRKKRDNPLERTTTNLPIHELAEGKTAIPEKRGEKRSSRKGSSLGRLWRGKTVQKEGGGLKRWGKAPSLQRRGKHISPKDKSQFSRKKGCPLKK